MRHAPRLAPLPARLRRTALRLSALALGLSLGVTAWAADPFRRGEVLLQLASTSQLPALQTRYQLTLLGQFGSRPIYRLKVPAGTGIGPILGALRAEPGVVQAEPNVEHRDPESRKNHPWAFGDPANFSTQWAPAALHLPQAHARATGAGVRVAVLDTGVDVSHPALAGHLLPGRDFVDGDLDPSEGGTLADPSFGHGTHVAGLVRLAAPGAQIMPLRVLTPQGQGNTWVLAEALLYAIDPDGNPATADGAQVINLSLGTVTPTHLLKTIGSLASCNIAAVPAPGVDFTDPGYDADKARCASGQGAVLAVAAGNDGSTVRQYPAGESVYGELAVGASTPTHQLAAFSNRGSWVDVAAPGEQITSSFPGGQWASWSGTSMATPLVAGTAALLREAFPAMSTRDLARRIARNTADLCNDPTGQVDAQAALRGRRPPALSCP